jgi:adenylate cyclase
MVAMRPAPRRLTVLASLDVAGYTKLVEKDERGTLLALASIRRHVLRPTIAHHGGNLFKTMGDGALVEFPSVEDAVEWAIAFQNAMAERNAGKGENAMPVRLGVALADVFVRGNDRFGAAVGFVVRLQQAAPPGGIAITHSVRWQLVKKLAGVFSRLEEVRLKGIDEPIEIWLWMPPGTENGWQAPARGKDSPPPIQAQTPASPFLPPHADLPSIAILAFDNMSGDASATSMADGIVEEITATLSRVRDFTVIARNSAYAYRGRAVDVRDIARELGVRYVLEGSVRKAGERMRVTAQLVDATSGAHLWADRYDGIVENLFDLEEEIAEKVAGALHPSIRAAEIALARRKRPESLLAYDLVLKALPHLWAHRQEDNAEAIRLLDEALRIDPTYARGAAVAAWARGQQIVYHWTTDIDRDQAEGIKLIERASDGSEDDPMALTALSTATMLLLADLDRAQFFVDKALTIDPNHAWAWTRRGFLDAYRGDPTSGIACLERAMRLSPLDPFNFICLIAMGFAKFAAGRFDEAAQWTQRALREKSGMNWAYRDLAVYLAHAGEVERARDALAKFTVSRPHVTVGGVGEALRFIEPTLLSRYLDGLRMAGLRE